MKLDEVFQQKVFSLEIDKNKPIVDGEHSSSTLEVHREIGQELFYSFGRELLRLDINRHKTQQEKMNDTSLSKERRYYVSTQARRIFKRLMVATRMDGSALTKVEIAVELSVTHKAATQLIDDAIGFDVIETIEMEDDICEQTGAVIKQKPNASTKRYRATQDWMNSFLNNGCLNAYENMEQITRARTLYSEYHRFMVLTHSGHGTGSYNMKKFKVG
jgi:hypothetical protein